MLVCLFVSLIVWLYICIRLYGFRSVRMHVRMVAGLYVRMYVGRFGMFVCLVDCLLVGLFVCMNAMLVYTYACMHESHACVHVYVFVGVHVCMFVRMRV